MPRAERTAHPGQSARGKKLRCARAGAGASLGMTMSKITRSEGPFFSLGERVDAVRGNRVGLILTGEPQVAALAEGQRIANDWLRCGDAAGVDHAAGFVRRTRVALPARLRVAQGRADGGFCSRCGRPCSRWTGRTTRPARDRTSPACRCRNSPGSGPVNA